MPDSHSSELDWLDAICDRFEAQLSAGARPSIEDFVAQFGEQGDPDALTRELVLAELSWRRSQNDASDPLELSKWLARFPKLSQAIHAFFAEAEAPSPDAARAIAATIAATSSTSAEPPAEDNVPGDSLGAFRLIELIDRGGMGAVYKAWDEKLQRQVAIKMIRGGRLASDEALKRFTYEAEAAGRLDHPGIVPIYEVGQHQGCPYFAMGLVEGESLEARLAAGPFPQEDAARLVIQLCQAVHYAHQQGIVHRDLKPGNILLGEQGQPRITDFGLAKIEDAEHEQLTTDGQILGTPGYMAPEQAAGKADVSNAVDIYGLGAILYRLLTGIPPFRVENVVDYLVRVLEQEPIHPRALDRKVNRDLETICMKCLRRDPSQRYGSARDLADDLQRFLDHEPIAARPLNQAELVMRWCRQRPMLATTWLALGAFLLHYLVTIGILAESESESMTIAAIAIVGGWAFSAWFFQRWLLRPDASALPLYLWGGTEVFFLTFFVGVWGEGPKSPLVAVYPTLTAASALRFRKRLVGWVTFLSCTAFLMLNVLERDRFESLTELYGWATPIVLSILVIGMTQYFLLRRAFAGNLSRTD